MPQFSPKVEHKIESFETYIWKRFGLDSLDMAPVVDALQQALIDTGCGRPRKRRNPPTGRRRVEKRGKLIIYDFAARRASPSRAPA